MSHRRAGEVPPSVFILGAANSIHTRKWAIALAGRGHPVTVGSWVKADPIPDVDLRVVPRLSGSRRGPVGAAYRMAAAGWWMRRQLRQVRPDIIHVQSVGMAGLLSLLAPRTPARVVTPWGSELRLAARSRLRGWITRTALHRADLVLPTSVSVTEEVVGRYRVPAARAVTVSWGVDDALGRIRDEIDPVEVRRSLGIPTDAVVVLSARNTGPVYRTPEILDAFAAAAVERPDLHLVVLAGQIPAEVNAAQAQRRCLDQARRLAAALPGRVTLIDRTVTPLEMFTLMCASEVVVSVPRWDQRSSTVLEAALAGCRLVLADLPAYHEMRADGLVADILPEPLAEHLAAALGTVTPLDDQQRRENRHFIETSESWSRQVSEVQSHYRRLLDRPATSSSPATAGVAG